MPGVAKRATHGTATLPWIEQVACRIEQSEFMPTVYLWSQSGSNASASTNSHDDVLDQSERSRAEKFRFELDRLRFIASRIFLRRVLGQHLNCPPAKTQFAPGPNGKPELAGDPQRLRFSLSRSVGHSICAVARNIDVGVDLEFVQSLDYLELVAESMMDSASFAIWQALDTEQRLAFFYRIWTRKESRGKADGSGISLGPKDISVPIEELKQGDSIRQKEGTDSSWLYSNWSPFTGCTACLTIRLSGQGKNVSYEDEVFLTGQTSCSFDGVPLIIPHGMSLTVRRFLIADQSTRS